jgi:photosystem II stability/assembly factor-like uncharacterized protein
LAFLVIGLTACQARDESRVVPSARWQPLANPGEMFSLSFADARHAWMIRFGGLGDGLVSRGHGVYSSTNGGNSWALSEGSILGHRQAGLPATVATIDSPQSIQVAAGSIWLVYQGPRTKGGYHAGVLVSRDGGRTWRVSLLLPRPANLIDNSSFVGARYGWITYLEDRDQRPWHMALMRTQNDGASWQRIAPRVSASPLPADWMQFVDARHGYLFNVMHGTEWRTSDGGFHWLASGLPDAGVEPRLFALDAHEFWLAVGNWPTEGSPTLHSGALYSSTDRGVTWQESGNFANLPLSDVWFANRHDGWVAGEDSAGHAVIYGTNDGGRHWLRMLDLGRRGSVQEFLKVGRAPMAWVYPDAGWNRMRHDYLYRLN